MHQLFEKVIELAFNGSDLCQVCRAPVELSGFELPDPEGDTRHFCSPGCMSQYLQAADVPSSDHAQPTRPVP